MTVQLYSPLSSAASSGLIVSSLTYGGAESVALVMVVRSGLAVSAGPAHSVFTTSPSSTYWPSVVVQVSVRGVPAKREPLSLVEFTTEGWGTEQNQYYNMQSP